MAQPIKCLHTPWVLWLLLSAQVISRVRLVSVYNPSTREAKTYGSWGLTGQTVGQAPGPNKRPCLNKQGEKRPVRLPSGLQMRVHTNVLFLYHWQSILNNPAQCYIFSVKFEAPHTLSVEVPAVTLQFPNTQISGFHLQPPPSSSCLLLRVGSLVGETLQGWPLRVLPPMHLLRDMSMPS